MPKRPRQRVSPGFTLIEVLVSIVILAVGLLGLALLQSTSLSNQLESYQRAQALLLLEDMSNRIRVNSNAAIAGAYSDGADFGKQEEENCTLKTTAAERDQCDWNAALAGAGVKFGTVNVGSVLGATGCIENVAGSADGETVIRLTIAWQGLTRTVAPNLGCGKDQFGEDEYRRVASVRTVLADMAL
jgi:type IV pilus assembly protein PilV